MALMALGLGVPAGAQTRVDLPSSKQLLLPVPGGAQRLNSLPMSLAVSPDGRWVVSLNAGYGTYESNYAESLAVMDTQSGAVKDFPDARVGANATQTFFSGLAFSADGTKVYASMASSSDPVGDGGKKTGNGIVVYGFADGALTPQGFLKLPLVALANGRHTDYPLVEDGDGGKMGIPYPAAIAVVPGEKQRLLVAENLADTVVLMDAATGEIERTIDLAESEQCLDVSDRAGGNKGWQAGVCRAVERQRVVELDLERRQGCAEAGVAEAASPTRAGDASCALRSRRMNGRSMWPWPTATPWRR